MKIVLENERTPKKKIGRHIKLLEIPMVVKNIVQLVTKSYNKKPDVKLYKKSYILG